MTVPRDHVCALCESSCDDVTGLRRENAALRRVVAWLVVELARSRDLTADTRALVEARFPYDEKEARRDAA